MRNKMKKLNPDPKVIKFAVVQIDACVFGTGSTREEAICDASEWLDDENGEQGGMSEDMVAAYIEDNDGFVVMPADDDEFDDYMKGHGSYEKRDGVWY